MEEKVWGIRSIIGRYKIDGDIKNSIGNGEAKELICKTSGHELGRGKIAGGHGGPGWRGAKREKLGQL